MHTRHAGGIYHLLHRVIRVSIARLEVVNCSPNCYTRTDSLNLPESRFYTCYLRSTKYTSTLYLNHYSAQMCGIRIVLSYRSIGAAHLCMRSVLFSRGLYRQSEMKLQSKATLIKSQCKNEIGAIRLQFSGSRLKKNNYLNCSLMTCANFLRK